MPRMNDWERDAHEAVRKEMWALRGPSQIVKVLPSSGGAAPQLGGYITLGKFLLGKTPQQIEEALGLPSGSLGSGARIFRFTRLPMIGEYEYELTALHPGGLAYAQGHSDPAYPPGNRMIHQWRIKPGYKIPVDTSN